MPKFTSSHTRIAIFALSILLVTGGVLMLRRDAQLAGFTLILLGTGGFLWATTRLAQAPPTEYELSLLSNISYPLVVGLLAVFCSIGALFLISQHSEQASYHHLTAGVWIASVVLIAAAALWADGCRVSRRRVGAWWRANRQEALLVGAIVLLALLARAIGVGSHPYPWSGDEASIGLQARLILSGFTSNFFETSWSSQPNWSFVPNALSILIFGDNLIAVRLVSVLSGTLAVLFVYLLGRELFNRRVGLMAAAFLALYPIHTHFSRIGVHNINDSLLVCLCLWLALRSLRTRRVSDYVITGIFSGLTLYTYVGARFVFLLVLGVFFYVALFQRKLFKEQLVNMGFFLLAALITMAPMGYFFIQHPDIFTGRIGQEGILFNGWLFGEAQRTGQTVASILLEQFSRSTLVYIADGTAGSFFNSPRPYLTVTASILFLLGMAYSFLRIRQRSYTVLLAWFWSVIFAGGVLTLNPPANTRLVMTGPAVALFVGLGLWQLVEALKQLSIRPRLRHSLAALALLLLAIENGYFYLVEYPQRYYFQDRNAEVAQHAALQADELGPSYGLYLFGAPHVFTGFPTSLFLAPDNPKYDPNADTVADLIIPAGQGAFFVALPENEALLEQVAARFPDGQHDRLMRFSVPDEVLYHTYLLEPSTSNRP